MAALSLAWLNTPAGGAGSAGQLTSPLRLTPGNGVRALLPSGPGYELPSPSTLPKPGRLLALGPQQGNPFERHPNPVELRGGRVANAQMVEPVQPFVPLTGSAIRIHFDGAVNQDRMARSFRVTPAVNGSLAWLDARTLSFLPETYAYDTTYTVQVAATDLEDEVVGGWQWRFLTVKPITITLDDCGTVNQLKGVLSVLADKHIKAIMFPIGWCAAAYPWLVPQMLAEGHRVCNHTYSHPRLTYLSDPAIASEIQRGVHAGCNLLRPPDGNWDGPGGRVERIATSLGYQIYMWDVDTLDYIGNGTADILSRIRGRGGVILMHYHGAHTIEALRAL